MDKQYILEEIKRTAAVNGGKPLGVRTFLKQTDIKVSDWRGVYWARWSDALREAGLAPNQKQAAYERDYLLEKYAGLTRKLGRFPAESELRMESRSNPEFPYPKTLTSRLGPKRGHPRQLIEYCETRPGYEDVIAACKAALSNQASEDGSPNARTPADGFVYLARMGKSYKLGRSNDFDRRLREIKIQLPESVEVVHVIRTDDPAGIEGYWHKRFEGKRTRGEWFALNHGDVRAFRRRKFM